MINKYIVMLVISVFIASLSQILLKKSTLKEHSSFLTEYLNPNVITGYLMLVISTILTILSFKGLDYKNGPIIESIGYIFVMILSFLFLKEKISLKKLLGNIIILIGIAVFYI